MDLKKQILVALGLDKQEEVNLEFQAKLRRWYNYCIYCYKL